MIKSKGNILLERKLEYFLSNTEGPMVYGLNTFRYKPGRLLSALKIFVSVLCNNSKTEKVKI